jgi:hypothetical protein
LDDFVRFLGNPLRSADPVKGVEGRRQDPFLPHRVLVTLVTGGREPLEGVECPQLGLVLVTPGFMVRESEGHPAPATKFRVVSVDAVERERFEGVVEELLPTCLLAPGRLKQELIPESVQHQILDSDPQSQHSVNVAMSRQLGSAAAWALLAKLSTIVSTCLRMTDVPGAFMGLGDLSRNVR